MNEKQMIKKWCPFSRVESRSNGGSYNRTFSGGIHESKCIGDQCNAFRVRVPFGKKESETPQELQQCYCALMDK